MLDGGCNAFRDYWDALERDSELLWLAAGDDLGDNNGANRFDAAAAAIRWLCGSHTRGLPKRASRPPCKRFLLVLTLPYRHIKNSAYLVFYRTPICSNYSKATLPHIACILLKFFRLELLPFLLYVPSDFLLYY